MDGASTSVAEGERVRLREGMTKVDLVRQIETSENVIRSWLKGTTIARKASVERIKEFLQRMRRCPRLMHETCRTWNAQESRL
jgi:hypothetical protein